MSAERPDLALVVNADDFGLSADVSSGILRAHREGIVTSTSVLGNCEDPQGVAALLREAPGLGVGVHVSLVGGRPVSPPDAIPALVTRDGRFPERARDPFVAWARGKLPDDQIERELEAQVARLRDLGLPLDHLNTHRQIGFLPPVGRALERVARRHGIPGIRMQVERPTLAWLTELDRGLLAAFLGGLSWLTRRDLGSLRHGPQSWGYVESGQLDEVRILEILGRLGPGSHELICHPGDRDDEARPGVPPRYLRAHELAALTSPLVRDAVTRRGIALSRWADLF